jgi:DNA-binding transcriptional MerR regulator
VRTLTCRQTADAFGVNPRTIRRWRQQGLLEAVETPYGRRYRADDVDALLADRDES